MKLLLILFVGSFLSCKQSKSEDLNLTELIGLSLVSSSPRCSLSSASNSGYFVENTIPTGGSVSVGRISDTLPTSGSVEIYYPKNTSTSLPLLVVHQGGNVHGSYYSNYSAYLASQGYVVYLANRCSVFFLQYFLSPSGALGNESLDHAKSLSTSSPLYGRIDTTKIAYLGHSLGGVIATFTANRSCESPFCDSSTYKLVSDVKALVFYGSGAGTSFSKYYLDSSGKGIPTAFLQGELDGAYTTTQAATNYNLVPSPKAIFTLSGANHYSITDVAVPSLANVEKNNATRSQSESIQKLGATSVLFLDYYLKSNLANKTKIETNNIGIDGVTVTQQSL
jgi:hypothetical protein